MTLGLDACAAQMSGFCTGAALASRGGANAAFKAGMVGGIILAVIEGLNIGMVRMFSNMGPPPDEAIGMSAPPAGAGEAHEQEEEQPWWHPARLLAPAPPPPDVDFSDPKEVRSCCPVLGGCTVLGGCGWCIAFYACCAIRRYTFPQRYRSALVCCSTSRIRD